MHLTYPAEQVDAILADMLTLLESSVEDRIKMAEQAGAEDTPDKILLQKVARITSGDRLQGVMDMLVARAYLTPSHAKQAAHIIRDDPAQLLDVLEYVAQFSAPAPQSGVGVVKAADHSDEEDPELAEKREWVEHARSGDLL